jgi:glycosyltransferase involved in cell wall biosynthesis
MSELLSICIPTYQRPKHLEKLLKVLCSQIEKFPANLIKIYISDNCSHNESKSVVQHFQKKFEFIIYNRNDKNIGMMLNFVKLIEMAEGQCIWLFGDDDELVTELSLQKVCEILENKNPDLLILQETEYSKLDNNTFFSNTDEFISYFSKFNPNLLWTHTWITGNIFKREIFDKPFAIKNINTFYMHMYGIMSGLKKNNGSVFILTEPIVKCCEEMGFREDNFPELRLKWIAYFNFLANMFAQPILNEFAEKWKIPLKEKFNLFLRYFNPLSYIRYIRKHL